MTNTTKPLCKDPVRACRGSVDTRAVLSAGKQPRRCRDKDGALHILQGTASHKCGTLVIDPMTPRLPTERLKSMSPSADIGPD